MKKFVTIMIVSCITGISGHILGQDSQTQKKDKKGGFAVGGYDATRQAKEVTRSVPITDEAEPAERASEMEIPAPVSTQPPGAPPAPPAPAGVQEPGTVPPPPPPPPAVDQVPANVPPPPPPPHMKEVKQKETGGSKEAESGKAYGRNKNGLEGKDFGQSRSSDAKAKQKQKKNSKAKGKK
jgi:hypothetical protein